jgi:hypothetical protein
VSTTPEQGNQEKKECRAAGNVPPDLNSAPFIGSFLHHRGKGIDQLLQAGGRVVFSITGQSYLLKGCLDIRLRYIEADHLERNRNIITRVGRCSKPTPRRF